MPVTLALMSDSVLPSSMAHGTTACKEMASLIASICLQLPALAGGMQMEARHGQPPVSLHSSCWCSLSKKPFVRLGSHIYELDASWTASNSHDMWKNIAFHCACSHMSDAVGSADSVRIEKEFSEQCGPAQVRFQSHWLQWEPFWIAHVIQLWTR